MLIIVPDKGAINLDSVKVMYLGEESGATYIFFDDEFIRFADKADAMRVFGGIVDSYQQGLRVFYIDLGVLNLKAGEEFADNQK